MKCLPKFARRGALAVLPAVAAVVLLFWAIPRSSSSSSPLARAAGALRPAAVTPPLHAAANTFLATLKPEQRSKTAFSETDEERLNWHFVPRTRKGLPFADMNEPQQKAALALLQASLSAAGYQKATTIRALEKVLQERENDAEGRFRNPNRYYFSVFGNPSPSGVWAWRYEGHHLSLHWTVINGEVIASSPQFFGASPARVAGGPLDGTRALAGEEDLGRALVTSLTKAQRAVAVLAPKAPPDILTGAARVAAIEEDKGIVVKDLTPAQRNLLVTLIRVHAQAQPAPLAEKRLANIRRAGLETVKFAWMGGLKPGEGHYYRVQGPTFLIEYDNTQNRANHVHTVWRSRNNDFGADLLGEHYKRFPHRP